MYFVEIVYWRIGRKRMRYETLFDGRKIPVLGLGTWNIGGGMTADYSRDNECIESIRMAIRMGYTHIDTAQMYGGGHTEELVGAAIKPFRREELFITTKVWSNNLRYRDVIEQLDESLKKLDTDYVDLYLIHWPNPSIPLKETFRAFNELVREGKVRYSGVSNFDIAQLKEAQRLSEVPIATNQVEYNLLNREPERTGMLEYCRNEGILITAYEPLGKGTLLGNPSINKVAKKYGISPAQVAIYWLLQKPGVITIPKSVNETHLRENLSVLELTISQEDMEFLDSIAG
jgi:diketogulonate reductase-like aldo/keto reductase